MNKLKNFIILDEADDADKFLLWENDCQLKTGKKIAIDDMAILGISQYRNKIVS